MVDREKKTGGLLAGAWTNVILGLIIVAVPFFTNAEAFGGGEATFWNHIIVGGAITLLALYNAWAARNATHTASWAGGLNVLLGIWLIIAPFVFGVGSTHLWADIILGALVALVAAYNTWAGASTTDRRIHRSA